MDIYYVDGEFVPENEAFVLAKDIAVLRGFGAFDFMRTYGRRPFHLEDHIARLRKSTEKIGLDLKWSDEEISKAVMDTLEKNPSYEEANIRIVVTGGESSNGVLPEGNGKLIIMVSDKHACPEWWYTDGAPVVTVDVERYIPEAKSINYMNAVIAQKKAKNKDAVEAIYVDREQRVLEGTTTNIYGFKGNKLVTPGTDILDGITRKVVLDLAKEDFEVEIRDIKKDELADFEEIFMSASNKEIVPVIKIDDLTIGNGKPGPKTQKIMDAFRKLTDAYGARKETA
ncbi:MAG: aminotransferase class IV [Spirochaetales bacterium]|nr:aminotransferase class IV [Spirochaetales bacterium]